MKLGQRPFSASRLSTNHPVPYALVAGAIIISALYFGRDVFVPLSLAVLLSFVLAPLVVGAQKIHLGKVPSVLLVVIIAFSAIFGLVAFVGSQVADLAGSLPAYQSTIAAKIQALRRAAGGGGTLDKAGSVLQKLDKELNKDTTTQKTVSQPDPAGAVLAAPSGTAAEPPKPIPVEVHQPAPTTLETLSYWISPLLHPLATVGIVVVFVIFILLQREDLRDRLIRLAGAHDLRRTTVAIDDAAKSLSKYFLTQVAVNVGFGILVGAGLTFIGVPNAILWGTLAAVLRFIPYIGSFIAAAFPIFVALAVDPGWSLAVWTALFILALELVVGQVVEPVAYGHSSGLSPLAVILAATFWAALWGPVGLLMATPLTICLVILGRHVDQLEFLDVILGDRPPLTPVQTFYQRLLAQNPEDAALQAETFMKDRSLVDYYDEIALKGLQLAQQDLTDASLEISKVDEMKVAIESLVEELSDREEAQVPADPEDADHKQAIPSPTADLSPEWTRGNAILCVGGRSSLDDASSLMLANLLANGGLGAQVANHQTVSLASIGLLETGGVLLVCLSYLDVTSPAHMRFAVRRLRRKAPSAKILLGCWGQDPAAAKELGAAAKADFTVTSFAGAVATCLDEARATDVPVSPTPALSLVSSARA